MTYADERAELMAELRRESALFDETMAEQREAARTRTRPGVEPGAVVIDDVPSNEDYDTLAAAWDRHDGKTVTGEPVEGRITRFRDGRVQLD